MSIVILLLHACKDVKNNEESNVAKAETEEAIVNEPFFKLSLAQWSMHKMIRKGEASPFDLAKKANEWGFDGVEYVSQLFSGELKKYDSEEEGMKAIIERLKTESKAAGIENVLIMVDDEGDLADPDESKRNEAVEMHKKWVDAAAELGCHAIRVNTFGSNDPEVWIETVQDGLGKLSTYAATKNINVLVENHGWMSSKAHLVMKAIKGVNMTNCGTLPDFGNWCVKRKDGENWGECLEEYPDYYEGIQTLMPAALAVSAKSYDFDENGNETKIDYSKMMKIIKDAGYTGYIGVEYEGNRLSEEDGITATRDLLVNTAKRN